MFYVNFINLCAKNNVSPADIAKAIGTSRAAITKWKNGGMPSDVTLAKLADYFGLTVDELVNEQTKKTANFSAVPNIISFDNFKRIPIIGTIACGEPILAEENHEGYTQTESTSQADFALRCKGDSMAPTFMDGDVVLIRQQPVVENGQIAAVLIGTEATLKHVYLSQQDIMLVADNPQYSPIVYAGEDMNNVRILGLAVGYTRFF